MQYGLIGKSLGHSFSKEIHSQLASYKYELCPLSEEQLPAFFAERSFKAINVTIPYKETVIKYLDFLSEEAKAVAAVNTIVNRDGRLYGYNTDYYGFRRLAEKTGIDFQGKRVLILGSGGASKAVRAVAIQAGAASVVNAVRHYSAAADADELLYSELGSHYQIIVNCTPVGMYPQIDGRLVDLHSFPCLEGVLDCVYNPIRTDIVLDALELGLPADGGMYMLVAQAVRAVEIFLEQPLESDMLDKVYGKLMSRKENLVLIGMPSCGKTTVGSILAKLLGRRFYDSDKLIVDKIGMDIPSYFRLYGEKSFRKIESEVLRELSSCQSCVIATGGGAVLDLENIHALKKNGKLTYLQTEMDNLVPTADRPLSSSREVLERMFDLRRPLYEKCADLVVDNNCDSEQVAGKIADFIVSSY